MRKILCLFVLLCALASMAWASPTRFAVDPVYSNLAFSIKNLQISTVKGHFKDYKASVTYDEKKRLFTAMQAVIKVASVDTDNAGRDGHLGEDDFFNVKKFPTMTFKMTSYKALGGNKGEVTGELTIAGVTKSIKLKSELGGIIDVKEGHNAGQKRMGLTLSGMITRSEFHYAPKTSTLKLGDEISLSITIEAQAVK